MPFLFIFFFIKLAFIFIGFMLMAFIGAEFLPDLANIVISSSAGTSVEVIGNWVAKGLLFLGDLCQRFLSFMFMIIEKTGIDTTEWQERLNDIDTEQVKTDVKKETRKF